MKNYIVFKEVPVTLRDSHIDTLFLQILKQSVNVTPVRLFNFFFSTIRLIKLTSVVVDVFDVPLK